MKNISCLLVLVIICLTGVHSASIQARTLEEPLKEDPSNRDLDDIVQYIQEIIKNTIDQIQGIITNAADELAGTLSSAAENIIAISNDAREQVKNAIAEMKDKIQTDLEIAKKCLEEHKADIDQVHKILESNLHVCANDYESKVKAAEQTVRNEIDVLLKLAATAEDIIPQCISENGLIQGFTCVLNKGKELRAELASQITQVKKVLTKSLGDIRKAVEEGRNCNKLADDVARLEIQSILKKINLCIDESSQNF